MSSSAIEGSEGFIMSVGSLGSIGPRSLIDDSGVVGSDWVESCPVDDHS